MAEVKTSFAVGMHPQAAAADIGAVTLIQRFVTAPNLNIHYRAVLDGVYCSTGGVPTFQEACSPNRRPVQGRPLTAGRNHSPAAPNFPDC